MLFTEYPAQLDSLSFVGCSLVEVYHIDDPNIVLLFLIRSQSCFLDQTLMVSNSNSSIHIIKTILLD